MFMYSIYIIRKLYIIELLLLMMYLNKYFQRQQQQHTHTHTQTYITPIFRGNLFVVVVTDQVEHKLPNVPYGVHLRRIL